MCSSDLSDTAINSEKLAFLRQSGRICLAALCSSAPLHDFRLQEHVAELGFSEMALETISIPSRSVSPAMEIVSTAQILNRSDSSGDGSSASAGGENPFAPKMPPRRKPSTGNTKTAASAGNDGPPPPP